MRELWRGAFAPGVFADQAELFQRNIKLLSAGISDMKIVAMNAFGFDGLNADELADALEFVNDIIAWMKVFVRTEDRRVFEAGREAGRGRFVSEDFRRGKIGDLHRLDVEAFVEIRTGDAEVAFRQIKAIHHFEWDVRFI